MTFWSARDVGALVGVGALKELAPDHGEIKSMRTAPAALGRGVGRGCSTTSSPRPTRAATSASALRPATPSRSHAALRLYESEGFEPCGPFGEYRDTAASAPLFQHASISPARTTLHPTRPLASGARIPWGRRGANLRQRPVFSWGLFRFWSFSRVETSGGIRASLAGRYASALFDLARDERQIDAVGRSLDRSVRRCSIRRISPS